METNMLIGILIGSGTVALLAFFAYRVKASFDRVTQNNEELNTRVFKSINDIHQSIDEVYRSIDSRFDEVSQSIDSRFDEVYQSVDSRFDEVYRQFDEVVTEMDSRFGEVYRLIDSRFDKTEARLKTELLANQLESQLTS